MSCCSPPWVLDLLDDVNTCVLHSTICTLTCFSNGALAILYIDIHVVSIDKAPVALLQMLLRGTQVQSANARHAAFPLAAILFARTWN